MDLRQLRQFVAVCEAGSFSGAANLCHVSQPAISASVASLEAALGAPLFERGAFGATRTVYGEHLYARARSILAETRRAADEIAALREGEGGGVAVGVGPIFERDLMPKVLAAFLARRPRVNVTTVEGVTADLLTRLRTGELDFTVSTPNGWIEAPDDVEVEVLHQSRDVIVAGPDHPIFDDGDFSLERLSRERWIVSAVVTPAVRNFYMAFAQAGAGRPTTSVRTDSIPILRELVLRNGFLAVVSDHFAALNAAQPDRADYLRVLPSSPFDFTRLVCYATRRGARMTTAAAELSRDVRAACAAVFGEA